MNQHAETARHVLDAAAVGTTVLALLDYAPKAAAVLSIIWLGIQIYAWAEKRWWRR